MPKEWLTQNAARQHRIAANGITLHAVELGAGPLIVLLSGWPQTWYSWHKLIPDLAKRHRVVAIDLPGLGDSDAPNNGYDTGSIALHLDAVLDAFDAKDCALLTHDIGAWIGYAYAARRPERVSRLALIDAAIPGLTSPEAFQLTPDRARKIWHFYFNCLPDLPELLIVGRENEFLRWSFRQKSHDWRQAFTDATIAHYVAAYARTGRWTTAMGYYRHIFESSAQNIETSKTLLEMPVLAVGGEYGLGLAVKAAAEAVAKDVQAHVIPECGHFVCEERPQELLTLLKAFISDQSASSRTLARES